MSKEKIIQTASVIKKAQGFYSNHAFDQHYSQNEKDNKSYWISNKQKSLIDIVMGTETNAYPTPLLDMMFQSPILRNQSAVSKSDKELLLNAWKNSSQQENSMIVADNFSDKELNALKAKGLISGIGHNVSFTANGRKMLVETILESKSSLEKKASNMKKFIKMCEKLSYPEVDSGVEKSVIVKDKNGNFVVKPKKEENKVEPNVNEVKNMSNESLATAYNAVIKAEKDYYKYKTAKSNAWEHKYDINKVSYLKQTIANEIERRKNAR